ncbi:hypothetical protein H6F77_12595 [Microcoleus sp. FACHB-831]|uniref:COP23 domain-containing protein n=1 Tax=Microcoleus sp. FACHB-831 TaxID=2692827 RepID=UPI00168245BB|nr:COP23 domain-containing protein [Microcoleus sp. FACHB-831]MBD1921925.1 hypothetical protein [Microcoleus sp. FACHB-831]
MSSTRLGSLERASLVVAIMSLVIGGASFAYAVATGWRPGDLFAGQNDRFSCQLRYYDEERREIPTVMYHNDKGTQPWLRMVNTFGEDWTTPKRCETIADRLESFRKDGLRELTYRTDSNTPTQSVICAKTKSSGNNCELLVTLTRDANAYESLKKMTEAMKNGNTVDQSSNGGSSAAALSPSSPSVPLGNLLADEDTKAGETPAK